MGKRNHAEISSDEKDISKDNPQITTPSHSYNLRSTKRRRTNNESEGGSPGGSPPIVPNGSLPHTLVQGLRKNAKSNSMLIFSSDLTSQWGSANAIIAPSPKTVHLHQFNHVIKREPDVINQKSSGRCWMFAGTNPVRIALIAKLNLKDSFEFSENYLYFFDMLEKSNLFLNRMIDTAAKPILDDDVQYWVSSPVSDGGHWIYFANLVDKYGLIPKEAMPETKNSSGTANLKADLNHYLRYAAKELRNAYEQGADVKALHAKKEELLKGAYNILVVNLGLPPKKFNWEYVDKKKKVHRVNDLTPHSFVEEHVDYDTNDYVVLAHKPIEQYPYYQKYETDKTNIEGGKLHTYINVPVDEIKKCIMASINDNEAVCLSEKVIDFHKSSGTLSLDIYQRERLYQTEFNMTRAERMLYRDIGSTHIMTVTGYNLPKDATKPDKWRVQNSWGSTSGNKGYVVMTDEWFDNYTFRAVVHKKYVPQEILDVLESEPVKLDRHAYRL